MKKLILSFFILAGFAMQALAYDFQSGNLLYTIVSSDPARVRVVGHINGAEAEGELIIPETVEYEGIQYSVAEIGKNAFRGCSHLNGRLVIPPTVTKIGIAAFMECSGFSGDLVIPNNVDTILTGAFSNCSGFDGHLYISESMKRIYLETFSGCSGLTGTLNIPESVTEIDADAFSACRGFTGTLVIPSSVKEIGMNASQNSYGAFQGCTGITGLMLHDSVRIIGYCCFAQTGITGEIVFPSGITEIWSYAFSECHGLNGIVLNEGLEYIGSRAFKDCGGLTGELVIPSSVKEIKSYAFQGCSGINSVVLREPPDSFEVGVFSFCSSVTSVILPDGMVKTGGHAFDGCTNLSSVSLPQSITVISAASFTGCTALTHIDFPENLKVIDNSAFWRSGLSDTLVLPKSIERIDVLAFCETNITEAVFGESLKELWENAFSMTPYLNKIVLQGSVPPSFHPEDQVSLQMQRDILIIVPCGTQETYQNTPGWNVFSNIQDGMTVLFSAVSSDETAGTVRILKEATCEDRTVEVKALPNEGWAFAYWKANGERISSDNPYSFELVEDTELVAYFSETGLNEMEQLFKVFPNPAQDQLRLQYSPDVQPTRVELYDLQGRLVRSQGSAFETFDLGPLPAGTYTLRVTMEDGQVFSDKVVKE